ncbi:MAG: 50S ribosomal protein L24 [Candidatus Aenigmatarchaeota archaeon]
MKRRWSNKWKGSKQPRKQRKYIANAPLHVRRKFVSAHLSAELRKKYGRRSLPLRKGDEVEIEVGDKKGFKGKVERISLRDAKVWIEGLKMKKADGSEVLRPINASNLKIISLNLDDKKRMEVLSKK